MRTPRALDSVVPTQPKRSIVDAYELALQAAFERKARKLTTDDLLLGVVSAGGIASDVLTSLGFRPDAVRASPSGTSSSPPDDAGDYSVSPTPAAASVLAWAAALAAADGTTTSSTHLLLALAYDADGVHGSTLRSMGIERAMLVESLRSRDVHVPAMPPPLDRPERSDVIVLPPRDAEIVIRALTADSVRHRSRYFDAEGHSLWAFGLANEQSGDVEIAAAPSVHLREQAARALEAARSGGRSQRGGKG
jgi:ClpA/ClpB-like protein